MQHRRLPDPRFGLARKEFPGGSRCGRGRPRSQVEPVQVRTVRRLDLRPKQINVFTSGEEGYYTYRIPARGPGNERSLADFLRAANIFQIRQFRLGLTES